MIEGENIEHRTGFFIEGETGKCTVLTSNYESPDESSQLTITTHDGKSYDADSSQIIDFSAEEFKSLSNSQNSLNQLLIIFDNPNGNDKQCSYPHLELYEQDVKPTVGDIIKARIVGYDGSKEIRTNEIDISGSDENTNIKLEEGMAEMKGSLILPKTEDKVIAINHNKIEQDADLPLFPLKDEELLSFAQTYQQWRNKAKEYLSGMEEEKAQASREIAKKINPDEIGVWEDEAQFYKNKLYGINDQDNKNFDVCKNPNNKDNCDGLLSAIDGIIKIKEQEGLPKPDRVLLEAKYEQCSVKNHLGQYDQTIAECEPYKEYSEPFNIKSVYEDAVTNSKITKLQTHINDINSIIQNLPDAQSCDSISEAITLDNKDLESKLSSQSQCLQGVVNKQEDIISDKSETISNLGQELSALQKYPFYLSDGQYYTYRSYLQLNSRSEYFLYVPSNGKLEVRLSDNSSTHGGYFSIINQTDNSVISTYNYKSFTIDNSSNENKLYKIEVICNSSSSDSTEDQFSQFTLTIRRTQ